LEKSQVAVVIAAYREERRIADVVRRVRAQRFSAIVVDDGSDDATARAAEAAGAIVLRHVVNLGKGAAMKTGCDEAFARGAKAVILLDGDGQHRPEEMGKFLAALNKGYAVVFGYRRRTAAMPLVRRVGNWFIHVVIWLFYRLDLHDALCGYRAFTAEAYRTLRWDARDYSVESEMIARAGKANLPYTEFQVDTVYHDAHKGMTIMDGIPILLRLVWWRMTH
jgi:glycosyltransferase involved in cell wall biosynthesis